jgi:hypothetical protein
MSYFRSCKLIDCDDDHRERTPIEPVIIEDWILRNHSEGDDWKAIILPQSCNRYTYCLCGHETPINNCLVINTTKKIGFIVGSKCVDKFNMKSIIRIQKTKKICLACGIPIPKMRCDLCSYCDGKICTFGKYKGQNMIEVYYKDKNYCDWLLSQEFYELGREARKTFNVFKELRFMETQRNRPATP